MQTFPFVSVSNVCGVYCACIHSQLNRMEISFKTKWNRSTFILFSFTGVITTKARIDYESIKQIYVTAYVTDTGIPQLTSTAEIIVDIVNANDNEPVFSLSDYRFTVAENSAKGTVIGSINAKDGDDGKFMVGYSILLHLPPLPIDIHSNNAREHLKQQ